jgi:hypothetical protein
MTARRERKYIYRRNTPNTQQKKLKLFSFLFPLRHDSAINRWENNKKKKKQKAGKL